MLLINVLRVVEEFVEVLMGFVKGLMGYVEGIFMGFIEGLVGFFVNGYIAEVVDGYFDVEWFAVNGYIIEVVEGYFYVEIFFSEWIDLWGCQWIFLCWDFFFGPRDWIWKLQWFMFIGMFRILGCIWGVRVGIVNGFFT